MRGRVGPGLNQVGLSRAHILASIDGSLKRLGLDHVDLYQIHGFDPATPIEETVRALDDVVRSGKARYVGFSNLPAWLAMKAIAFADANGLARFQSAQVYYSIAGRDIEREIVPLARTRSVAILPWSPLAGGLLSGKFDPDKQGPADARRDVVRFPAGRSRAPAARARRRCARSPTRRALSVARVALAWQLTRPFVTSIIIGAKTHEQLADNLAATEVQLSRRAAEAPRRRERAARRSTRAGWSSSRTASRGSPPLGRDTIGKRGLRPRGRIRLADRRATATSPARSARASPSYPRLRHSYPDGTGGLRPSWHGSGLTRVRTRKERTP